MEEKEELMKVTNKLNTITLHQVKVTFTTTHQNEILNFLLYNRALGNEITSNEVKYKLLSIDEE